MCIILTKELIIIQKEEGKMPKGNNIHSEMYISIPHMNIFYVYYQKLKD